MTTCLDLKGTFSDFEITYYVIVLLAKQTAVSKLSYFFLSYFFHFPPPSFSLDFMDRKFDQVLSLQQLDKSKAISQILEEVTI